MAFKEGEIVRYGSMMAEIKKIGIYQTKEDYNNNLIREDLVMIKYYSQIRVVNITELRKATKEDKFAYKYLSVFKERWRDLYEYKAGDIISYNDNIQEVYDVKEGMTLILEDGPVPASDVIPVCFKNQRLDV